MTDTTNLALPLVEGAQAQKHVTHNEALRILDTLVQLAVLDRDLNAPPAAPSEGQRWIVKASPAPTGAWTGHPNQIAAWQDAAWQFNTPKLGWVAYVVDEGALLAWNGTAWVDALAMLSSLQNIALLGLGTSADTGNPFSARLNNLLFAAKTVSEGGSGDLRCKLSKESAAKTLSFLFQDNFSGRAEIGLTGDDDLHFKVSPDGSAWFEALRVDRASGKISFPVSGGPREVLSADRTYYVRTDGNDANNGLADSAGGAFATWQHAVDVVHETLDLNGRNVVIQAGGSSGTFTGAVVAAGPFQGAKSRTAVKLKGNAAAPASFILQTTNGASVVAATDFTVLAIEGFKFVSSTGNGHQLDALRFGIIVVTGAVEFGSAGSGSHVFARRMGYIEFTGGISYTISGGASNHWRAANNSIVSAGLQTITLTGTPAFTAFLSLTAISEAIPSGSTFSGAATGSLYTIDLNSAAITGGLTLPGNAAGTTATGGQYT
jgi:hypothetical protein